MFKKIWEMMKALEWKKTEEKTENKTEEKKGIKKENKKTEEKKEVKTTVFKFSSKDKKMVTEENPHAKIFIKMKKPEDKSGPKKSAIRNIAKKNIQSKNNTNANTASKNTTNKNSINNTFNKKNTTKEKINLWDPYIYWKKRKWLKSFPFVKPRDAFNDVYNKIDKKKFNPLEKDDLRILCFWWFEQVWMNCIWFEYRDEILIVDMWLQFPDMYSRWINFRIPDLNYLKSKKIVGIAITHWHIDHIWAIPYIAKVIWENVPIFATPMAYELIKMKQEDFNYKPKMQLYERDKRVSIWKYFSTIPFVVDHSIPDSVWLYIKTPIWNIVHTWDWKFDKTPPAHRPSVCYKTLESFWNVWVKMLLSDSTNAMLEWFSMSEKEVIEPLSEIFAKAKWRIITATFASLTDRIVLMIKISHKLWRKVVLLWKWMNDYMTIAKKLWYTQYPEDVIISMEQADKLPPNKVTICCTWAQWERYAALMRMATWESKDTSLMRSDTVVFSSSVIPWNERSVQELFWLCKEQGVDIHHYKWSQIHAWWHAKKEDIKHMLDLIRPEYFMPIYGEKIMIHENAEVAKNAWYKEDKIIIANNWECIDINKDIKRSW